MPPGPGATGEGTPRTLLAMGEGTPRTLLAMGEGTPRTLLGIGVGMPRTLLAICGGSEPNGAATGPEGGTTAGAIGALAARGAGAAACCALGPRAPPGIGVPGIGVPGGSDAGAAPGSGVPGGSDATAAPWAGVLVITGIGDDGVASCTRAATSLAPPGTFCVGASRGSPTARRAPHPPQNREFGSFWVPQLAQRIPAQA
jgi:hypothetical protein